jgi:hypothetical protein
MKMKDELQLQLTSDARFSEGAAKHQDRPPFQPILAQAPLQRSQDTFTSIFAKFSLPLSYIRMLKESSTVFLDLNPDLESERVPVVGNSKSKLDNLEARNPFD